MKAITINMLRNKTEVLWLGALIFFWAMLRVWQGLDFNDMGYWLTGEISSCYTYPQAMGGGAAESWLSYFIGHWFGVALGGVVLSYKLGYVLVVTATTVMTYLMLIDVFGRSRILTALVFLSAAFVGRAQGNWVGYNNLTALFYLAGAALLYLGLVRDRKFLVAMAGAVLGINIFIRFPNLLAIALVSAIWLHAWVHEWSSRATLTWTAWFLAGYSLGIAMIWGLIVLHGHEVLYFYGLGEIFGMATDAESHHSGVMLLKLFAIDQALAFACALPIVAIGLWVANWIARQRVSLVVISVWPLALLLFFILNSMSDGYSDFGKWAVTGLCYIGLLTIGILEFRKNRPLALMAFIAGLTLVLVPVGSANGIANSKFGMWIALPLVLMWLWRRNAIGIKGFNLHAGATRIFSVIVLLALLFQSVLGAWRFTSRDSTHRLEMTSSASSPLLIGTFTTKERAKTVSELLDEMRLIVKPGDDLLAYNEIPTVNFLTATHPWLRTPSPMLLSPKEVDYLLREKEKTSAKLPVIVRAKGTTTNTDWPHIIQPFDNRLHGDEIRSIFMDFERRHGYVLAWSNEFFEILLPPGK